MRLAGGSWAPTTVNGKTVEAGGHLLQVAPADSSWEELYCLQHSTPKSHPWGRLEGR